MFCTSLQMLTWNLDWILSSLDNTHHSFVPSARRKQQEAERSAPVAPPPGQYNVQLDPLSVMAKKKKQAVKSWRQSCYYFAFFSFWWEKTDADVLVRLPYCQVPVQQVRPLVSSGPRCCLNPAGCDLGHQRDAVCSALNTSTYKNKNAL